MHWVAPPTKKPHWFKIQPHVTNIHDFQFKLTMQTNILKYLTCEMKHCCNASRGSLSAELGHATLGLNCKCVVHMRFQLANRNLWVFQGRLRRFKSHPPTTRRTQTTLTALACHIVCDIAPASSVCWWAPSQLQTPCSQEGCVYQVLGWARQS